MIWLLIIFHDLIHLLALLRWRWSDKIRLAPKQSICLNSISICSVTIILCFLVCFSNWFGLLHLGTRLMNWMCRIWYLWRFESTLAILDLPYGLPSGLKVRPNHVFVNFFAIFLFVFFDLLAQTAHIYRPILNRFQA